MTLRRREYIGEAKKETYASAQVKILDILEKHGWKVKRGLKIPHATKGDVKLWFKKQAIYASGSGQAMGSALSLQHIDPKKLADPRVVPLKLSQYMEKEAQAMVDSLEKRDRPVKRSIY